MAFMLIDIFTFLIGQPVIARLLWIILKSKKTTDILNCSLALFHNLQYFVSVIHFFCLFLRPTEHMPIIKFLFVYVETGGPMSLTFICLERYFAVIYPTSYPLLRKYRFRELCACSVWLISLSTAFCIVSVRDAIPAEVEQGLRTLPPSLMVFMTGTMVCCSIEIARELKKSGPRRDALHPVKKKALRTVCGTTSIIVLCYSPVSILQKITSDSERLYDCLTTPISILCLSVASVVHPIFYLSTQGKLFFCLKRRKKIT